jgi:IS30 family transposase
MINPRKEHKFKKITFEERQVIERMIKDNAPTAVIGHTIKKSSQSVAAEIKINGGRENYTAEIAQQRVNTVGKYNPYAKARMLIESRIDNLQMQIDILTNNVTKLMEDRNG